MCCYSVIFAIFPDFGEKLKVALHCPKSYSTRENQVTSALPSHHLLLSLLCLPKHPFLGTDDILEVTSSLFLLVADLSNHVPVLGWGRGRCRLRFRFIEEHKFLCLPRQK